MWRLKEEMKRVKGKWTIMIPNAKLTIKNVWKNMTPCKVYFSQNSKPDYEEYADCRNDFDIKLDSFFKKKLHETSRGLASFPFPPPCKSRGSAVNRT